MAGVYREVLVIAARLDVDLCLRHSSEDGLSVPARVPLWPEFGLLPFLSSTLVAASCTVLRRCSIPARRVVQHGSVVQ